MTFTLENNMSTKKIIENEILALDQTIQAIQLKVKALALHIRSMQNVELEKSVINSVQYRNSVSSAADESLANTLSQEYEKISMALHNAGLDVQPWTSRAWGNLCLPIKKLPPEFVRIGDLLPTHLSTNLPTIPALLPIVKSNHVLVFHPRKFSSDGCHLLTSIIWRIVVASSPENYRFAFIDSIDRGRSFASFLNLPEVIRGNKIYCQGSEIEEILQRAVNDMEEIIQQRLRETYDTIEDYNAVNPHTAVPYHFIVFTAYPEGFSDLAAEYIGSLARTGIRAGYYLIGGVYTGEAQNASLLMARLMEQSACISIEQSDHANWDDPSFAHLPIRLDKPPSKDLVGLISSLAEDAFDNISNTVEFAQFAPEISDWMQYSSQPGLVATIGMDQNGKPFDVQLGPIRDTFHAIVGGRIHSGKTNFLHGLILSLCLRYSDDELHLYLVDFKEGVEFQDYALHQLPHARSIVIEAEREFGLSVLDFLSDEMEKRSEEFKAAGVNVVNIEDYRSRTKKAMPRIVVIMDEFVKLFEEDDVISDRTYQLLLRIAQRSRAFGIHLILAAQRPVGSFQNLNPIKSQIGLRIAFKCNEPDDSSLILGERNEKAAYLERNGLAYITYEPTLPERSNLVKISYVGHDDRKLYLEGISSLYRTRKPGYQWHAIVFKKWEPAYWHECLAITQNLDKQIANPEPNVWLGQPVRLAEDQAISFLPQEGENAILLGPNERFAFQTLVHALLSLTLTIHPDKVELFWLTAPNNYPNANEYLQGFKQSIHHSLEISPRSSIHSTLNELVQRMERRDNQTSGKARIFLLIPGIHRISEFRDNLPDSPTMGELLEKLLQQGPQLGIHVILWSDRYETLRNIMSMNVLDYFNHRIGFHMGVDDSNTLLGVSDASKLGTDKRLLYRNQHWEERAIDKVKPYDLPSLGEFQKVVKRIQQRWE